MKNKLILSIAMSSIICLEADLVQAAANNTNANLTNDVAPVEREEVHGGKCAAGKCGTSKAYETSNITYDPQDYLVRARDGKCGVSGKGAAANTKKSTTGKCASGVCGQ